jgi:hypothetical protein
VTPFETYRNRLVFNTDPDDALSEREFNAPVVDLVKGYLPTLATTYQSFQTTVEVNSAAEATSPVSHSVVEGVLVEQNV